MCTIKAVPLLIFREAGHAGGKAIKVNIGVIFKAFILLGFAFFCTTLLSGTVSVHQSQIHTICYFYDCSDVFAFGIRIEGSF